MAYASKFLKALNINSAGMVVGISEQSKENCGSANVDSRAARPPSWDMSRLLGAQKDCNGALDAELRSLLMGSVHKVPGFTTAPILQPQADVVAVNPENHTVLDNLRALKRMQVGPINVPVLTFEAASDFKLNYFKVLLAYNQLVDLILSKNSELSLFNKFQEPIINHILENQTRVSSSGSSDPDIDFDSTASD